MLLKQRCKFTKPIKWLFKKTTLTHKPKCPSLWGKMSFNAYQNNGLEKLPKTLWFVRGKMSIILRRF